VKPETAEYLDKAHRCLVGAKTMFIKDPVVSATSFIGSLR
jgi:hypothetical protein